MNLIEIIKKIEQKGHTIVYSHRKDGGYLIHRIDGVHYSGASGNQIARQMAGAELSQARKVQLSRIKLTKGHRHRKQQPLPEELLKRMKKIQRKWRKTHKDIRGTISMRGLRYHYAHYGEEKTLMALDSHWRYAEGYAYIENVQWLLQRIQNDLDKQSSTAMEEAKELIKANMMTFKEEWIQPIHYDCLQQWERNIITDVLCAQRIKTIMGK